MGEQAIKKAMFEMDYHAIGTLEHMLPNKKKFIQIDFKRQRRVCGEVSYSVKWQRLCCTVSREVRVMETIRYIIAHEEDGTTVRHILRAKLHFSSHAVSRLTRIENGILVNGKPVHTPYIVRMGDELCVKTGDHRPSKTEITPGNWPLPIIWEDGHLLVVNKPAGMTAHASNFLPDTPTVAGALAWTRGTDFIFHPVNRLDKGTTGLMVVAKSGYIHDLLRRSLHTERFQREYRAICVGVPTPPVGVVDAPVGRDETSAVARKVRPDGALAVSHYEVLTAGEELSYVRLVPKTGRTHQLRVHMAHIGCPLLGDWLYGTEAPEEIARPALHAHTLTLVHPVTKELLRLTAPLPPDFCRCLRRVPFS